MRYHIIKGIDDTEWTVQVSDDHGSELATFKGSQEQLQTLGHALSIAVSNECCHIELSGFVTEAGMGDPDDYENDERITPPYQ